MEETSAEPRTTTDANDDDVNTDDDIDVSIRVSVSSNANVSAERNCSGNARSTVGSGFSIDCNVDNMVELIFEENKADIKNGIKKRNDLETHTAVE